MLGGATFNNALQKVIELCMDLTVDNEQVNNLDVVGHHLYQCYTVYVCVNMVEGLQSF